jgi:hypothetical protein
MQALRGAEAAAGEFSTGNKELRGLLAKVHSLFRSEMELWAGTHVDGVVFCDDLGWPGSPRISPKTWRSLFKPLYREYCDILHAQDKFVFFNVTGQVADVFEDLVEIGVDAIHSQLSQMDFGKLASAYRGRVTFWGEFDRPEVQNAGKCQNIHETILRARQSLDFNMGGVIAQRSWAQETPLREIATFCEDWLIALPINV